MKWKNLGHTFKLLYVFSSLNVRKRYRFSFLFKIFRNEIDDRFSCHTDDAVPLFWGEFLICVYQFV